MTLKTLMLGPALSCIVTSNPGRDKNRQVHLSTEVHCVGVVGVVCRGAGGGQSRVNKGVN